MFARTFVEWFGYKCKQVLHEPARRAGPEIVSVDIADELRQHFAGYGDVPELLQQLLEMARR